MRNPRTRSAIQSLGMDGVEAASEAQQHSDNGGALRRMKAECFPGSDIAAPSLRGMSSTERLSFPAALLAGAQQGCVLQVQLRAPDGHIPQDVGLEFIEPRMGGLEGTLKVIETWDHGMVGLG